MIEVYNFLDGKNLCNIFASLIVGKINELFPDAETEITVLNVRNFFIVRGKTNSDVVINCAEIFQDFIKTYDEEKSKTIRVIDVIQYTTKPNESTNFISNYHFKKDDFKNLKSFLNQKAKENIYINIKIDQINDVVFFDSNLDDIKTIEHLKPHFNNYNFYRYDFSNETFTSDKFYGLSNNNEKLYHMLLRHISFSVSSLGISKELNLCLHSNVKIDSINNLNVKFNVLNDNHIVKTSWLESLILDVFPFEYEELKNTFDVNSYDVISEFTDDNYLCPWQNLDKINELILV